MENRNWYFSFVNKNNNGVLTTVTMYETIDDMTKRGYELVNIIAIKSGSLLFVGWKKSAGPCPMMPMSAMRQVELDVE